MFRIFKIILFCVIFSLFPQYLYPLQDREDYKNDLIMVDSFEKIREYKKALEIYRNLYNKEPNNPIFSSGFERNMLNLKLFDELTIHYKNLLKNNPLNISIIAKLGESYYQWGKTEVADSIWSSIIDMSPEKSFNYSYLSNILISNRLFDKAVDVLILGRKRLKDNALFDVELANLYFWKKDYINGVTEYMKILKRDEKYYSLVESQILEIFPNNDIKYEEVADLIKLEFQKDNKNINYHRLLAGIYFINRNYELSFQEYILLDKLLSANGKEVLKFAEEVFKEKQYNYSAKGYEWVKVNFPDIPEITSACFGLSYSYENSGSPSKNELQGDYVFLKDTLDYQTKNLYISRAISEYENIINKYSKTIWAMKSYFRIGEIKLNVTFDLDGAIESFTNIVELSPDSQLLREAILKVGDCMLAKGDLNQAEQKYDEIINTGGNKPDDLYYQALYKKSLIKYLQADFISAKEIAQNIIMQQPPYSRIYNDVLEMLMLLEETKNEQAFIEYVKALRLIHQRKYSEAIAILEELKRNYVNHPISDDSIYMIGKLKGVLGNYNGSIKSFKELIKDYPNSSYADEAQLRIGEIYEILIENYASAEKEYESLLINYPNSIYVDETRKRIRTLKNKQ